MNAFFGKISAFFLSVSLFFTYLFGLAAPSADSGIEVTGQNRLLLADALCAAQGMCFDGEYYYSSGSVSALNMTSLAKWDKSFRCIKKNTVAVPREFTKTYGSNHIGGIDLTDSYIYAPVEGKTDNGYEHNFVLLYDKETLEYTGIYYELTCDKLTDGIPWCAADEENGYFYTSKYNGAEEILRYDLKTMEFLGTVPLSQTLNKLQGGDVYGGVLYLSADVSDSVTETVYAVELATGNVRVAFERTMCSPDNEAEDIFVYPFPDGSLFHVVDYDKLLGVNVTHYR